MDKFADGLPYYRQQTRFDRVGFPVDRSTIAIWADRGAKALKPLYQLMLDDLRRTIVLGMDETPLPQLDPGRGKVKTGYLWTLMRDPRNYAGNEAPCAVFKYAASRPGLNAEEMLDGFSGKLHVDAYAGYNRLTATDRPGGPVELSYCWAHAKRKFVEIMRTSKNDLAAECIRLIDAMFKIEKRIKGKAALVRKATRQLEMRPLVDEVFELMKRSSFIGLKKSPMGKALAYALTKRTDRINAIRDGIKEAGHDPSRLTSIDIYDCNKLAAWANTHPSVALWLNAMLRDVHLSGFQTHEDWSKSPEISEIPYQISKQPRYLAQGSEIRLWKNDDPSVGEEKDLQGIRELIFKFLGDKGNALRVFGPSGFGKTRFVYELINAGREPDDALDANQVVYCNYDDVGDRLLNLAREMADSGSRAILIVDDCPNPNRALNSSLWMGVLYAYLRWRLGYWMSALRMLGRSALSHFEWPV